MPAGSGEDAERFAAAVERGIRPTAARDRELATDLQVVAMLRALAATTPALDTRPDPAAKARARRELMASFGTAQSTAHPTATEGTAPLARVLQPDFPTAPIEIVPDPAALDTTADTGIVAAADTDGPDDDASGAVVLPATRRRSRHSLPEPAGGTRGRRLPGRRFVLVAAAGLAAVLAASGGGVFASRDALPGDALYGVKRATEATGLAFTGDPATKGKRHLELATTRMDELERLVGDGSDSAPSPDVVADALREFDASAADGSRELLAVEDSSGASGPAQLAEWAKAQSERLEQLRPALPQDNADEAGAAQDLLDRLLERAGAVQARSGCSDVLSEDADDLGRLPSTAECRSPKGSDGPSVRSADGTAPSGPASTTPGSTTGPSSDPTLPAPEVSGADTPPGADAGPDTGGEGGLLPGLGDGRLPLDGGLIGGSGSSSAPRTTPAPTGRPGTAPTSEPDGGLIEVPPLLPGLPGLRLGD